MESSYSYSDLENKKRNNDTIIKIVKSYNNHTLIEVSGGHIYESNISEIINLKKKHGADGLILNVKNLSIVCLDSLVREHKWRCLRINVPIVFTTCHSLILIKAKFIYRLEINTNLRKGMRDVLKELIKGGWKTLHLMNSSILEDSEILNEWNRYCSANNYYMRTLILDNSINSSKKVKMYLYKCYWNSYVDGYKYVPFNRNLIRNIEEYISLNNNTSFWTNLSKMSPEERNNISDKLSQIYELRKKSYKKGTFIERVLNSGNSLKTKNRYIMAYENLISNISNGCPSEKSKYKSQYNLLKSIPLAPYSEKEDKVNIKKLKQILEEEVYGLEKEKRQIITYFIRKNICKNNKSRAYGILLVGPPGVGKTQLAKSIESASDVELITISMDGMKDANILKGHSSTYIGARPGLILEQYSQCKNTGPVFLLDEIDKAERSAQLALMNLFDPSRNNEWVDNYIPECPVDLSKCCFIATANNIEHIDKVLLNRMIVINVSDYNFNERMEITQNFLWKKELGEISVSNLKLTEKALELLVKNTEKEPGVRGIVKDIRNILDYFLLKYGENIEIEYIDADILNKIFKESGKRQDLPIMHMYT